MDLSIIIPTKDRALVLKDTLEKVSMILLAHPNIEAIVVNDSSTSEIDFVPQENLTVIRNPKSGVASARNFGASLAKSDGLLFLDDDILVEEIHIKRAMDFLKESPNACLNLDWIYPEELLDILKKIKFGRFMINNGLVSLKGWASGLEWYPDQFFERTSMASQFLVMHKSVFDAVGKYNESFPHAGFEDYDFQERLKKKNIKLYLDTRYATYHNEKDRHVPLNWLKRKEREGETRAVAVKIFHYSEKDPGYSSTKMLAYSLLIPFRKLIYFYTLLIPNLKFTDFIYNRLMHWLSGIYHNAGYRKIKADK